ncbi:helix-turn-helix domain-containing protein [Streptomyces albiaxialis]
MTPDQEGDSLAALLRELKERSGQSYGALAKRLHMSTSTLHRYCNGDAVPTEFAPVDRLGRLCGAKQDELVELHRRWILADASRSARKKEGGAASAPPAGSGSSEAAGTPEEPKASEAPKKPEAPGAPKAAEATTALPVVPPEAARSTPPPKPAAPSPDPAGRPSDDARQLPLTSTKPPAAGAGRKSRRRPALIGAATALVVVLAVSVTNGLIGGDGDSSGDRAAARDGGGGSSAGPSDSGSDKGKGKEKGKDGKDGDKSPGAGGGDGKQGAPGKGGGTGGSDEAPLSVSLSDSVWNEKNCLQSFLIDREPEQVGEFTGDSTTAWARGFGGVDAKNSNIGAIVQGKSDQKVVLKALRAKVVSRGPALKWNHYDSASGCGSGALVPASYDIALDNAAPQVRPVPGEQQGKPTPAKPFPRTITANDPEALAVQAETANCDCRWYMELDWSSGDRSGTIRIDDGGRPFRTSAVATKNRYTFSNKPPYWVLTKPDGSVAEQPGRPEQPDQPSEEPSEEPAAGGR